MMAVSQTRNRIIVILRVLSVSPEVFSLNTTPECATISSTFFYPSTANSIDCPFLRLSAFSAEMRSINVL
jgi:hypothetical protein